MIGKQKMQNKKPITDITIEIFNHCAGSCTGCLLSTLERKGFTPLISIQQFEKAIDALVEWGERQNLIYRPLMVFGDIPWLPIHQQDMFYRAISSRGLPLGLTMTLVEEDKEDHYKKSLDLILSHNPDVIFDITVDPVRLERKKDYADRIRYAIEKAPGVHLQTLLSEVILDKYSPEELAKYLDQELNGRSVSLGFTPSLTNLSKNNYKYDVSSAGDYAIRFYQASEKGKQHLKREVRRFEAHGNNSEFLTQTFHINPKMDVYPVSYTIWGDVILDPRNGGKPLGNLSKNHLSEILDGPQIFRQSIINSTWMMKGDFGCDNCDFYESCKFNGIGTVRNLYQNHENRTGTCYGPKGLSDFKPTQTKQYA